MATTHLTVDYYKESKRNFKNVITKQRRKPHQIVQAVNEQFSKERIEWPTVTLSTP